MKTKKIVPAWVGIVLTLLSALALFGIVFKFVEERAIPSVLMTAGMALCVLTVIFGLIYCFFGYSKKLSKVFLLFTIAFALAVLAFASTNTAPEGPLTDPLREAPTETDMAAPEEDDERPEPAPAPENATDSDMPAPEDGVLNTYSVFINSIASVLIFAFIFTLAISKNLGKIKSYILISATAILSFGLMIVEIFKGPDIRTFVKIVTNNNFWVLVLALVYGVMIYAKYKDKESRGAK